MKKCPFCAEEIQDEAVVCRYCGRDLPKVGAAAAPQDDLQRHATQVTAAKKSMSTLNIVVISLVVILCVLSVILYSQSHGGGSSRATDVPDWHFSAYYMCKDFISKGLKAPSTAEFQRYSEITVKDYGSETFGMRIYVDAENSFGAMIRGTYDCKVRHGEGDMWYLEQLDPVD